MLHMARACRINIFAGVLLYSTAFQPAMNRLHNAVVMLGHMLHLLAFGACGDDGALVAVRDLVDDRRCCRSRWVSLGVCTPLLPYTRSTHGSLMQ